MAKYFIDPFAISGDRTAIPDASQPDGTVNYTDGFGNDYQLDPDTDPDALNIPRLQFNDLMYQITLAIQQYQQKGFPDFISTADNGGTPFPYSKNATVRYNGVNYYSLVDTNVALPTDTNYWSPVIYAIGELTGVSKKYHGSTLPSGYVWENGTSIGNASSGATGRANADTSALFTLLWNSYPQSTLPVQDSSGTVVARGVSAAADYASNRRMPTPDSRGRASIGKDDMGGATAAGRITVAGSGIDGSALGASGGVETVQLNGNQNGAHTHTGTTSTDGVHTHKGGVPGTNVGLMPYIYGSTTEDCPGSTNERFSQGSGIASFQGFTSTEGAHNHTFTTSSSGLGSAHQNVQPSIICNWIIKL